jgi:DNA-binding MarR family transcriptional regulator
MYRLTDAFPYLLNRVGVRMGELFSRRLEAFGVTLPMYRVMVALWERGDRSLGDLSAFASIELSTLSRLVGTLHRRGLVSRRRLDTNGRVVEINLTAEGRRLTQQLIPLAVLHEDVGLRGFEPGEVMELKRNLARVYENLRALDGELSELARPAPEQVPVPEGGPADQTSLAEWDAPA